MLTDMYRIAHIENNFTEKFAVPRQSGLASEVRSRVVFEPQFRIREALRGLTDFSHIWLIWEFDRAVRRGAAGNAAENAAENTEGNTADSADTSGNSICDWRPTVRPPRLGGNERLGVFATRSPFRPNAIGLSCVELESIDYDAEDGPVLIIKGADLMNGTPIFDIKPYIPYADCKPEATGGFTDSTEFPELEVSVGADIASKLSSDELKELISVLRQDPRPAYKRDSEKEYTFTFAGCEITFTVKGQKLEIVRIS